MSSPVSAEVQQAAQMVRENRLNEAITTLQGALARVPDDFSANHMMGVALGKAGRGPEAVACLLKATRVDPGHTAAQTHLGMAYAALNKPELARPVLENVLRLDPNFKPAEIALSKLPVSVASAPPPMPAPSPFSASSHMASSSPPASSNPTGFANKAPQKTPQPASSGTSMRDEIAQAQKAQKSAPKVHSDIDWGPMLLQAGGAIVFVLGVFLWFGNMLGFYRTFPLAGYITMVIGGAMWKAA